MTSADKLIDTFAHELAERIRHHDFDANLVGVSCCCSEGLTDDAADLIDPYDGAGSVRPDEEPT